MLALCIPVVVCASFIYMKWQGIDLHIVSLGTLIVSLGLLVDDAIIVIEMMQVKLEEGMDRLAAAQAAADAEARRPFLQRWLPALWQLFLSTVPVYVITVLALSLARVWLFPHVDGALGDGVLWIVFFAVVGTLFVIPTAAEIPIVQGMLTLGLGTGSAGALLLTLPSVSLPSLLMMRDVLGTRLLWTVAGWVALVGVLAGLVAYWV